MAYVSQFANLSLGGGSKPVTPSSKGYVSQFATTKFADATPQQKAAKPFDNFNSLNYADQIKAVNNAAKTGLIDSKKQHSLISAVVEADAQKRAKTSAPKATLETKLEDAIGGFTKSAIVNPIKTVGNAFASGINFAGNQINGTNAKQEAQIKQALDIAQKLHERVSDGVTSPEMKARYATQIQGQLNIVKTLQQAQKTAQDDVKQNNDPLKVAGAGASLLTNIALPGIGGLGEKVAAKIGTPLVARLGAEYATAVNAGLKTATNVVGGAAGGGVIGAGGQLAETGSKTTGKQLGSAIKNNALLGGAVGLGGSILGGVVSKSAEALAKRTASKAKTTSALETAVSETKKTEAVVPKAKVIEEAKPTENRGVIQVVNREKGTKTYITPDNKDEYQKALTQIDNGRTNDGHPSDKINAAGTPRSNGDIYHVTNRTPAEMESRGFTRTKPASSAKSAVVNKNTAPKTSKRIIDDTPEGKRSNEFIQAEAARVSTPEQYKKETIDYLWENNKKGSGVEFHTHDTGEFGVGSSTNKANYSSNNSSFYRNFYDEYGYKPTKKEITNLVNDHFDGKTNILSKEISPEQTAAYDLIKERHEGLSNVSESGAPNLVEGKKETAPIEQRTSGGSTKAEARAVEAKVTKSFDDKAEYGGRSYKEEAQKAIDLVDSDYQKAKDIATGKIGGDNPVHEVAVARAVEAKALKDGDIGTLQDLASSSRHTTTSEAAQRLGAEGYGADPSSAVDNIREVVLARTNAVKTRAGNSYTSKVKKESIALKKNIAEAAPTKEDWNSFIESIKC